MMKRFAVLWILMLAALIVVGAGAVAIKLYRAGDLGGGGSTPRTSPATTALAVSHCPAGASYMGCSIDAAPTFSAKPPPGIKALPVPKGAKFPDVSDWQGCNLDWKTIGATGAAVKVGEATSEDTCAAHNVSSLRAANKTVVPYWFVRPIGCTAEADHIVSTLRALGLHVASVVIYTAPGTWPGGSSAGLGAWEAAYGASRPALPFSAPILAWQFTDHGYVAGLGYGDLSVNYGLLATNRLVLDEEVSGIAGYAGCIAPVVLKALAPATPTPAAYAIYPVQRIEIHGQKISERNTVATWWARGCKNPVRREVCKSTHLHLVWLSGRLVTIADRSHPPNWKPDHRGARHYRIARILTSH